MSYINNPDITKEDILKKSLAHWNVGKTQEWIDRDMAIVMGKREGYYFWDMDGRKFLDIHINGGTYNLGHCPPQPSLISFFSDNITPVSGFISNATIPRTPSIIPVEQ